MSEDEVTSYERVEVHHKGVTSTFQDFGKAIDYAKKLTQFEDYYNHAYVIRKVKIGNLPHKSYVYSVEWVDGSVWLICDLL